MRKGFFSTNFGKNHFYDAINTRNRIFIKFDIIDFKRTFEGYIIMWFIYNYHPGK